MILLALSLLATPSFADVVGPEPENCPDGSDPWSSHAGNWCEASYCGDDPDACGEGETCQEISLCVETEERGVGGGWADSAEPGTFTAHEVHGTCDPGDECDAGVCETEMRCAPEGGPVKQACGCATGTGSMGLSLALLVGLGLLLGRRD
ncbi:MAG: hypothetical protein H6741_23240 [Alphaproteobacteria bacterium]|nr:hypothetical protein [Alphaproteobacteria bacterium]